MGLSNRYPFFEESEGRLVLKKEGLHLPPKIETLPGWRKRHKKMNELVEYYNEKREEMKEYLKDCIDNALKKYYEERGVGGITKIMCEVAKYVAILQEQKILFRQSIDELIIFIYETKKFKNKRKVRNQLDTYKSIIDRLKINKKGAKEYSEKKVGVATPQTVGNTVLRILTCLYSSYDYLSEEVRMSQGEKKRNRFSIHHNLKRKRKMKKLKGTDNKKHLAYNMTRLKEWGKEEVIDTDNLSAVISRAINNEDNILKTLEKEKKDIKEMATKLQGIARIAADGSIGIQQVANIINRNAIGLQNSFKNIDKIVEDEAKEGASLDLLEDIKYALRLYIYVELYRTGSIKELISTQAIFEEKLEEVDNRKIAICFTGVTISYALAILFLAMGPVGAIPSVIFGGIEIFFAIAQVVPSRAEKDMKKANEVMYGEALEAPQNEMQYPKKPFENKKEEDPPEAKTIRTVLPKEESSQPIERDEEPEKKPFKHKIEIFSKKVKQ